jgi:hypothetical protein
VLSVVLILSFTLFTVRDVKVEFQGTVTKITADEIITAAGIKKNKSIFAFSENEVGNLIQEKIPTVKVVNIERRFPDTVVIHAAERYGLLIVPVTDGKTVTAYALTDRELSVMDIIPKEAYETALKDGVYKNIAKSRITANADNVKPGRVLNPDSDVQIRILANIVIAYERLGLVNSAFTAFVSEIEYVSGGVLITTVPGVKIEIANAADAEQMIKKSYDWYLDTSTAPEANRVLSGIIIYDETAHAYKWYDK